MFLFIAKKFINNHDQYNDPEVRHQYGVLCSVLSIISNIVLAIFKIFFGIITNSIAILSDGINNVTDIGSNVASWFGFKMANKRPDKDHPYGHGRSEYIVGLFIAFFIVMIGIFSLQESISKILNPTEIIYSNAALVALIVSIIIKLWMMSFSYRTGKNIQSTTLIALSKDSMNDVLSTSVALIALVTSQFTNIPIDGILGGLVSLVVIKSGYEVCKDTIDPLLGMAPDTALIEKLKQFVLDRPGVLGVHDLMLHDYGPGRQFLTLHAEVDVHGDLLETHDQIDLVEREILEKYNIFTTIHIDPIDMSDTRLLLLKKDVEELVLTVNHEYSIHDFRAIFFESHTNLIFDVVIPLDDDTSHKIIRERLEDKISTLDGQYNLIIQIEHSYI